MATKRISANNANQLIATEFENGVYLQPHSGDPGELGLDNVIEGAPRVFCSDWSVPADKEIHNTENIEFENMPPCNVNHFSVWDALEDGNFKRSTPYIAGSPPEVTTVPVLEGDTLRIPAEAFSFRLSNVAA
jgi:hypothetical protein